MVNKVTVACSLGFALGILLATATTGAWRGGNRGVMSIRGETSCARGTNGTSFPHAAAAGQQQEAPFDESSCFVNNSLVARARWLRSNNDDDDDDGYIMIHHVRRAGGSTLCRMLTDESDSIRGSNCNLQPSKSLKDKSGWNRTKLVDFTSTRELEQEMKVQRTNVVAVEGYELPEWFLNDPRRSERWTIVTSIRDPIDRLLSLSRLRSNCPTPEACKTTKINAHSRLDENGYPLNNIMTRMFAGNMEDPNKNVTEQDYHRAIHNLESQYQLILLTSWFAEMAPILKYWLGVEGDGTLRSGVAGRHSMDGSSLGREAATQHYLPMTRAKNFVEPELYAQLVQDHAFDFRLLHHFQAREKWRATNCFLYRASNLPLQ